MHVRSCGMLVKSWHNFNLSVRIVLTVSDLDLWVLI
jgi:hypothetical protein